MRNHGKLSGGEFSVLVILVFLVAYLVPCVMTIRGQVERLERALSDHRGTAANWNKSSTTSDK